MKMTKNTAWVCVAICVLLSGCRQNAGDQKVNDGAQTTSTTSQNKAHADEVSLSSQAQAEQKIEVEPVTLGAAVMTQQAKGRIALPDNATWRVGVLTEGRVERVYFNLGDLVHKGDVLARMHSHDVHEARAAYADALLEKSRLQAAEALAQTNYGRSQRLYALKAESISDTEIAKQQLVDAQSAVREADVAVQREKAHLEEFLGVTVKSSAADDEDADLIPIKAPATGRILQKNVTPGATISPTTDAFVIGNLSRLWMLASVDPVTLGKLRIGEAATVAIPDVPGATYSGRITNLGQEFDPVTRLMQVRIEIENPGNRLRPEMLATAAFTTGEGQAVIFVPEEAIQQIDGQDVVFVRSSPERFRVQAVQEGETIQRKVRILHGVKPGEWVISRGSFIAKSELLKSSIGD